MQPSGTGGGDGGGRAAGPPGPPIRPDFSTGNADPLAATTPDLPDEARGPGGPYGPGLLPGPEAAGTHPAATVAQAPPGATLGSPPPHAAFGGPPPAAAGMPGGTAAAGPAAAVGPPAGGWPAQPAGYGAPAGVPAGYGPAGAVTASPGYGAQLPTGAPSKAGGKGCLIAAVIGAVLVLLLGGVGIAAWLLLGDDVGISSLGRPDKQPSIAHSHLPSGCGAVVRVDVAAMLRSPAFKKHITPAIEEQTAKDPDARDFKAFLEDADIDPDQDLKELVLCLRHLDADTPDLVAVLGGQFRPGVVIPALEKHSNADEIKPRRNVGGLEVLESAKEPAFFSQAEDGALIFANKLDLLQTAAKATGGHQAYQLSVDKDVVGLITADAMRALAAKAGDAKNNPLAAQMTGAGRVMLSASLSTRTLEARLSMGSAAEAKEAAQGLGELKALISEAAKEDKGPKSEKDALAASIVSSASIEADGKELVIRIVFPQDLIDEMAREAAKGIRKAKKEGVKL